MSLVVKFIGAAMGIGPVLPSCRACVTDRHFRQQPANKNSSVNVRSALLTGDSQVCHNMLEMLDRLPGQGRCTGSDSAR